MSVNGIDPSDTEYQDAVLESANRDGEGWSVQFNEPAGGWLWIPSYSGEPHVGDKARLYGRGFGYVVRGVVINNITVYYRTPAEERAKHEAEQRAAEAKRQAELDAERAARDARRARLPEPFNGRFERFEANNSDWRRDYETYELFCCEEAVKLTALGSVEAIREFHDMSFDQQQHILPAISDQHSGNTFGFACRLAVWLLSKPELIVREHGALCPLVGCVRYGCRKEEKSAN